MSLVEDTFLLFDSARMDRLPDRVLQLALELPNHGLFISLGRLLLHNLGLPSLSDDRFRVFPHFPGEEYASLGDRRSSLTGQVAHIDSILLQRCVGSLHSVRYFIKVFLCAVFPDRVDSLAGKLTELNAIIFH